MTKNMKTTKNNEKEASEAKKEYDIKKYISKKNGFKVSPLCHISIFQTHPPTQNVTMTF